VSEFILDPCYQSGILQNKISGVRPKASEWGRRRFMLATQFFSSNFTLPLTGFNQMAILAWVTEKLESMDGMPFALYYWDLRPYNVILDQHNLLT
jgi:hypothetical protein